MSIVVEVAHWPASGVKVYVVVVIVKSGVTLLKAGDHVPVIPFKDVVGNGDKVVSVQTGVIGVKFGVTNVVHGFVTEQHELPKPYN